MKKVTVVVEGKGDVDAASSLISRIGSALGHPIVVVGYPIRSGEAKKLNRAGELERFVELALRRLDSSEVIVLLDLDDDCAATFFMNFRNRLKQLEIDYDKIVHVCFCVREFESWFLSSIEAIRAQLPDFRIDANANFPDAEHIRGAKEALSRACQGRRYRESRDQSIFAKKIDVRQTYRASRSFRHLVKAVMGMDYGDTDRLIAGEP